MEQRLDKRISSIQGPHRVLRYRRAPEQHHRHVPEALQPLADKINRQYGYADFIFPTCRRLYFFDKIPVRILLTQVFAEAHELSVELLLLDLQDHDFFRPVRVPDPGSIIQAINGQRPPERLYCLAAAAFGIQGELLGQGLQGHDIQPREGGEEGDGHGVVFHQVFEDHVVHGVCNLHERLVFFRP